MDCETLNCHEFWIFWSKAIQIKYLYVPETCRYSMKNNETYFRFVSPSLKMKGKHILMNLLPNIRVSEWGMYDWRDKSPNKLANKVKKFQLSSQSYKFPKCKNFFVFVIHKKNVDIVFYKTSCQCMPNKRT